MQCVFEPYEGDKPYIFVSYSHKDGDRVAPILDRMYREGYRIWYDEGIDWGTEWPAEIEKHLRASTVCLAFHSASSVESLNCRQEITFAIQNRKGILPIYLEQVTLKDGLEMQMTLYQAIHHWQYQEQEKFFARLFRSPLIQVCRDEAQVARTEEPPKEEEPETDPRTPVEFRNPLSSGAPVLMIGLGGTGARCVDRIKETISRMTDDPGARVQFLALDTDHHDLQGLTHLEEEERFFIRIPNPMDPVRQVWNETLLETICRRVGTAWHDTPREVYVISGSGGNTGAGMFLKIPELQTRLGTNLRFTGVLIRQDLFRAVDRDRKETMKRIDEQLLHGLEQGEDRSADFEGYQRCWMVDTPQFSTLNDGIYRTAEILAREVLESQLVNCMEPIGFWTTNREQGLSVSRMNIARADWNTDRTRRIFAGKLLRHIGLGGPGVDGGDFLGKNNYPDRHRMEKQVDELLLPLRKIFDRMHNLDDSYLDQINYMSSNEAVRYLLNGGEQELMRIQDGLIHRALDVEGLLHLVEQVRQAEAAVRNDICTLIRKEGLHYFLHLYHGVYRNEQGSLEYDGLGIEKKLRWLIEGHWGKNPPIGRRERAEHMFMGNRQELFEIGNSIHRLFHARRLRDQWADSFRDLGHARVFEARAKALLGRGRMLDQELVEKIRLLALGLDRFAWILESLCEPNMDWERVSVPGDLVELERIDPHLEETYLNEIRRHVAMADPETCRELLVEDWIANGRRWAESPEDALFAWMARSVSLQGFDLVWFFQERMNQGSSMNDTAHLLLRTMAGRSAIWHPQEAGANWEAAYLLIPDALSQDEPVICNALMSAARNLGIYIQVISSKTAPLCMIRGGGTTIPARP